MAGVLSSEPEGSTCKEISLNVHIKGYWAYIMQIICIHIILVKMANQLLKCHDCNTPEISSRQQIQKLTPQTPPPPPQKKFCFLKMLEIA